MLNTILWCVYLAEDRYTSLTFHPSELANSHNSVSKLMPI